MIPSFTSCERYEFENCVNVTQIWYCQFVEWQTQWHIQFYGHGKVINVITHRSIFDYFRLYGSLLNTYFN